MLIKLPNDISLWARRLALYFSIYVLIIGSHLFFKRFDWWHTNVDSARYMLSALVQGEAAIVALVVTLSLVAVQLAAQSYSARVIEVFRKAPDLWILMAIYGVAIFYGLGVLKLIETVNPQLCTEEYICFSNLESYISFAYYFGIFAFMALVPYMLKMFEMLKPSTVINMLAERITRQSLQSAIKSEQKVNQNDQIQPIVDIVHGALMKYDYETLRDGLKAIGDKAGNIFENENFERDEEVKISKLIIDHITRVGKLSIIKGDEDSTVEVITNLRKIGITTAKRKLEFATYMSILSIQNIGLLAVEKKLDWTTIEAVISVGGVGKVAAENKLGNKGQDAELFLRIFDEKVPEQNLDVKFWIKGAHERINEALSKLDEE